MKQTAVEWYAEQAMNLEIQKAKGNISITKMLDELTNILNKAKEMEKEQMENFFKAGVNYGAGSVFATEWGEDTDELNFEKYYKENYQKEEQ